MASTPTSAAASSPSLLTAMFAVEQRDGAMLVTAHVAGDFPGSPVDLRYAFELHGEKIARLEIAV